MSSAVSGSRVPWSADRWISEASSAELRADRSSSWGSMPRRRTSALAEPLSPPMIGLFTAVNPRMKPWVARAVPSGSAIARFLGTSSPKIIVSAVDRVSAMPIATGVTAPSGRPAASSGPSTSSAIAGSARKPMARLVTVMPTCAPESWVERDFRARCTPWAPVSPLEAAFSTALRSTVTRANSAATKMPHASTRRREIPSRIHSVMSALHVAWRASDYAGRPWRSRQPLSLGVMTGDSLTAAPAWNRLHDRRSPRTGDAADGWRHRRSGCE